MSASLRRASRAGEKKSTNQAATSTFTGTTTLVQFMLQRDRIRLVAWVYGMTLMMVYVANALGFLLKGEALQSFVILAQNPVMGLIGGPNFGFDHVTVARVIASMYGVYFMLGVSIMSIMTVSRHTRVEEQTGREELIRANVVGRHAQLTAALIVTAVMNVMVALLVSLAFFFSFANTGSFMGCLLFGLSVGAAGLVWAGVAAITTQLSAYSRAGSGIAGAVLAAAFLIRGLGDMSATQGGGLTWFSWLSPLGWSQQTAPLTENRWWPLLLSLALTVILIFVAYNLHDRRDLGSGVFAERLGAPHARRWLAGPFALAFRLQRASLIGWSVALFITGVALGAFAKPMVDAMKDLPPQVAALMGGGDDVVAGYFGFIGVFVAIVVAVYAIVAVQMLLGEEQGVHTEPVLSASVGRTRWLLSWTSVTVLGSLWLLCVAGLGGALGVVMTGVSKDGLFGQIIAGHVVNGAPVLFLLGLAVALYGFAPRYGGFAWVVFGYGFFMSLFGQVLQLGTFWMNFSPFSHVGEYPAVPIQWGGVAILLASAVVMSIVGVAGFRRRDLITA